MQIIRCLTGNIWNSIIVWSTACIFAATELTLKPEGRLKEQLATNLTRFNVTGCSNRQIAQKTFCIVYNSRTECSTSMNCFILFSSNPPTIISQNKRITFPSSATFIFNIFFSKSICHCTDSRCGLSQGYNLKVATSTQLIRKRAKWDSAKLGWYYNHIIILILRCCCYYCYLMLFHIFHTARNLSVQVTRKTKVAELGNPSCSSAVC